MKTKTRKKIVCTIRTGGNDDGFRFTVDGMREFIRSQTRTRKDTNAFLHRIGLRIAKDGSTYVVPV